MFTRTLPIAAMASLVLVLATIGQAYAVPTKVVHQDVSLRCDFLLIPNEVDEIGHFAFFPPDEALDSLFSNPFGPPVCLQTDDPNALNFVVEMRNMTGRDLEEVWYVANIETTISNFDGFANDIAFPITAADRGQEAFRIDHDLSDPGGSHHPLISESIAFDGIWQAGESWQFVLQDYANAAGIGPAAFTSIGVGDASSAVPGVTPPSSGSIIAIPRIPEPSSAVLSLIVMGGMGMIARHRRV